MITISHKITGETTIDQDTQLTGMIVGKTIVSGSVSMIINGMINGDLILESGSYAYVHGIVNGDIVNNGGNLEIFGTVNGKVIRKDGQTTVDTNAIVRDGVL